MLGTLHAYLHFQYAWYLRCCTPSTGSHYECQCRHTPPVLWRWTPQGARRAVSIPFLQRWKLFSWGSNSNSNPIQLDSSHSPQGSHKSHALAQTWKLQSRGESMAWSLQQTQPLSASWVTSQSIRPESKLWPSCFQPREARYQCTEFCTPGNVRKKSWTWWN